MSKNNIFKNKSFTFNSISILMVATIVCILVIINLFISGLNVKYDLNQDKRFSISNETINYLKTVNKSIKIIVFSKSEIPKGFDYIFQEYQKNCINLKIEHIDPDLDPQLSDKYRGEDNTIENEIVVTGPKLWKKFSFDEMINRDETGSTRWLLEQKITGAISFVNEESEMIIYCLNGHGEIPSNNIGIIRSTLQNSYYTVKDLNIISEGGVPKDASLVAIIGPHKDINTDEKAKIDKYLASGGKVLLAIPSVISTPNINAILQSYNVSVDNDCVIEGIDQELHLVI